MLSRTLVVCGVLAALLANGCSQNQSNTLESKDENAAGLARLEAPPHEAPRVMASVDDGEWIDAEMVYSNWAGPDGAIVEMELVPTEVRGGLVPYPQDGSLLLAIGTTVRPGYLEVRSYDRDPRGNDELSPADDVVCSYPPASTDDKTCRNTEVGEAQDELSSLILPLQLSPGTEWVTVFAGWTVPEPTSIPEYSAAWLLSIGDK
jgi:hypothetical protein